MLYVFLMFNDKDRKIKWLLKITTHFISCYLLPIAPYLR